MKILQRLSRIVSVLVLVAIMNGSAFAQTTNQTANGFRVSPIRNEMTIEKGKSGTERITVENPTGLPMKVRALINDFIPSDSENGQPQLLLDGTAASSHSLKKLMQAVPDFDIAANERKDIFITITIPSDAPAGGYYGAVRFVPADSSEQANVNLTASVGSLFLINVPGDVKQHLSLVEISAAVNGSAKKIITGGDVSLVTRLKNDGDTHEKPFGKIQVKDSRGKVVANVEINDQEPRSNVLPNSIRKFETSLGKKKWLGHYTVTASLGYEPSTNKELINAKTSFWYIPLWLLIAGFVLLVAVVVAGYILIHRLQNRRSKRR